MSRAAADGGAVRRRQHAAGFAALGDETRLSLVSALAGGEPRSIVQLTDGARMSRQAISKHLRVLQRAGLVRSSRSGRENLFEFNPTPVQELRSYLERVSAQWDEVLGRLKTFVER
jgi:DNA-binding transcriptional ArsR family regulator